MMMGLMVIFVSCGGLDLMIMSMTAGVVMSAGGASFLFCHEIAQGKKGQNKQEYTCGNCVGLK